MDYHGLVVFTMGDVVGLGLMVLILTLFFAAYVVCIAGGIVAKVRKKFSRKSGVTTSAK